MDGPQHFGDDGLLQRKDQLKEALYRRRYPGATFTRIRYDQVDRLGPSYVSRHLANYITLSMHTVRSNLCPLN